ncbi:ABC transporter ATP-binding protein [Halorussus marinus]|uniref:ABC transporter ATP-binding protein n=1 Tax=Halorussus marinus TaxID=2505976 RepID=UPI00106E1057|nr:oligopeptide/dipeptide ABC transporter ATP-binding protein [Halorussus marinus]
MTAQTTETSGESSTESDPVLSVSGLKKYFDQSQGVLDRLVGHTGTVKAVDGVDLTLREGETLAVVGESGCGKSTLAQTVLNLHRPTAGSVRYRGDDIAGLTGREMRPYRREMQVVFQDPLASLNPRQTVGEILTAPLEVHDIGASDDDRLARAKELLERVGLKPAHVDRYPRQFSGGQQQRIAVARALAVEPDVLVADEPVSALDVSVQAQILNLLEELQADLGLSLLFITHDLSVVRHIADRVAVMYLGKIVETAPAATLFEDPDHPYTESLLSAVPRIDPDDRPNRIILEGTVPSPLDPPSGCRFHTRCPAVIPSSDWRGTQAQFRAAFTFRNRVLDGELDPDAARTRLESEDRDPTEENVSAYLVAQALPGDPADLPSKPADAVRSAADALAAGDHERAEQAVTDAFRSPCDQQVPRDVETGDRLVACHRYDPDAPGGTEW